MSEINQLCAQLASFHEDIPQDEEARKKLMEAARRLSLALEKPGDTIQRLSYLALPLTVARIANDLDLFEMIVESPALGTDDIAVVKNVDPLLLGRLLRYLASHGMVKQTAEGTWIATNITKTLSQPGMKAGINHNFETILPCLQKLPQFLADTHYANPSDMTNTAFQRGHNTTEPLFGWIVEQPFNFDIFNQWMTKQREGRPTWLDVFSVEETLAKNIDPETPLFVDVGGGVGHQCAALKARYPHVKGRVILQDLPQVLEHKLAIEGVEAMGTDFWKEQPVKGARAYYLRNILHDYPDTLCIEILSHLIAAMSVFPDSVILIDEMVMPDRAGDTHWLAATLDIVMMTMLAAAERTERQWLALLDGAGLRVREVVRYGEELRDSVLVVVPK